MEYTGYTKIENSSKKWINIPKGMKWAVVEKVHGSCFCFIYDIVSEKILCAKRKNIIKDNENFFGYVDILEDTFPKIKLICEEVYKIKPTSKYIYIYGELFGGSYPNIESKYKPVQCGIYYSPLLHFYAFDISYNDGIKEYYLDFEISIKIFNSVNILYCKPIKIYNEFEKAIEHPIGFNTTIPKIFGLPDIKINKAEGIIIRSMKDRYILKKKIPEFSETIYEDNNYINENEKTQLEIAKIKIKECININRLNNMQQHALSLDFTRTNNNECGRMNRM